MTFTDVDDIGYLYVENLDSTNFVLLGLSNPVSAANCFAKLRAGEFCLIPTIQETIYAIADTASCNVFHVAAEL